MTEFDEEPPNIATMPPAAIHAMIDLADTEIGEWKQFKNDLRKEIIRRNK